MAPNECDGTDEDARAQSSQGGTGSDSSAIGNAVASPGSANVEDDQSLYESLADSLAPISVATLSRPWQYDDAQPGCTQCGAAFTALERRHHCRSCGQVFCHNCSRFRALIPPSSIVMVPKAGRKASVQPAEDAAVAAASFTPDLDPDRMLTFLSPQKELIYGKGLEERFHLAREPLRVCAACREQLAPLQEALRNSNSHAMRFNSVDPTDPRRLFNSPLAFTLGHEIRKASYTLNNLLPLPRRMGALLTVGAAAAASPTAAALSPTGAATDFMAGAALPWDQTPRCRDPCAGMSPSLSELDGVRIPARLLEQAKGVAVMTVVKGGFGLAGVEFGTGLVVARVSENRWSAPSAIGAAGLSWGALIGAQVSDHVFLLMTDKAVELLFQDGSVQLGVDVGIALGPLGRSAEADVGASPGAVAPIYSYSLSKGFYAGISLDGKVIMTRPKVNEKFYGQSVTGMQILQGVVPCPPAAQPLYEALTRCHVYATGNKRAGIRPSAFLSVPLPMPIDPDMGEYGEMTDLRQQQAADPESESFATPPSVLVADSHPTSADGHAESDATNFR